MKTLRERAIEDGRITRYARTPDELDALGFHAAADVARHADREQRATTEYPKALLSRAYDL